MSFRPVRGTASGERHKKLFIDLGEQWSSLLGGCNWYDFTLIQVGGEWAPSTGRFEFAIWVLGVGVCITYVYDNSFNEEMMSAAERFKAEVEARTGATAHDPFGLLEQINKTEEKK